MILNEVEGGDQERSFRVPLHPAISVVTGLSSEQRREFGSALSAAMHGYQVGLRLNVNIFGQEGRLSPQVIAALGFAGLDVDNILDASDLPGAQVADHDRPNIHQVLKRLRRGDLAQTSASVVAIAAPAEVEEAAAEPEEPQVDPYEFPAVREKVAAAEVARSEVKRLQVELTNAQSEVSTAEEALTVLKSSLLSDDEEVDVDDVDVALPPQPQHSPPALPELVWEDAYSELIIEEEQSIASRRAELERLSATIETEQASADDAIEKALADAESTVIQAEANETATANALSAAEAALATATDELTQLQADASEAVAAVVVLAGPAEVEVPSSEEVTSALQAATATVDDSASGPTPGQLAARWDQLSSRLLELRAAPKPPAWLVAQVRDEFDEAKARVTALRFQKESGIDVREVLGRAEERLTQATAAWDEMKAGPALEYERADAEATQLYADGVQLLGFQPGRKFLSEALRAEQEKRDENASPDKQLRDALARVGVKAVAGEAVKTAERWLVLNAQKHENLSAARAEHQAALLHSDQLRRQVAVKVSQVENDLAPAVEAAKSAHKSALEASSEARAYLGELRSNPDSFKQMALDRVSALEAEMTAAAEALASSETSLQELITEQTIDRERSKRDHERSAKQVVESSEAAFAKELSEWEAVVAELTSAVEEKKQARAAERLARQTKAEAEASQRISEADEAIARAMKEVTAAEDRMRLASTAATAAQEAITATIEEELSRLRRIADEERAAAAAELAASKAASEAATAATEDASGPWWLKGQPVVAPMDAGLDLTKVKREELDFYVLAKGASLRSVGRTESMPLIIDAAFDDLPPLVAQAAFDVLTRISAVVQVVYLAGNEKAEKWIDRQRDSVGRETQLEFS